MAITHHDIEITRRSWPHHPTTPTPAVTLTARQAQQILRSLATGFASTIELNWIAEQLGADHLAHPLEQAETIRRIIDAVNDDRVKDQDLYRRGYNTGRADGERIARDQTWGHGYDAGYSDAKQDLKPNRHPPDSAGHDEIALL